MQALVVEPVQGWLGPSDEFLQRVPANPEFGAAVGKAAVDMGDRPGGRGSGSVTNYVLARLVAISDSRLAISASRPAAACW